MIKQKYRVIVERTSIISKVAIATVFMLIMCARVTQNHAATQVSFEEDSWNSQTNQIIRNGAVLPEYQPIVLPDYAGGLDFQYVLDDQFDDSRSLTGSAVGNPQIYQHIYGFSEPSSTAAYITKNQTGYTQTMVVTADNTIAQAGKIVNSVNIVDNIKLDGSLLLAKPAGDPDGFKNLLASFNVLINKLTEKNDGTIKISKVFKGTVQLIGNKNGKVKIKTSGNIKKKYISEIVTSDRLIQVKFDNVEIPYKTKVKVGREYTLDTQFSSLITTTGLGTGAEVDFGPGAAMLPEFQEQGIVVPEPLSALLLLAGLIGLAKSNARYKSVRS